MRLIGERERVCAELRAVWCPKHTLPRPVSTRSLTPDARVFRSSLQLRAIAGVLYTSLQLFPALSQPIFLQVVGSAHFPPGGGALADGDRATIVRVATMQVRACSSRLLCVGNRNLQSKPKAAARLELEVSAGRASPSSRGLWC